MTGMDSSRVIIAFVEMLAEQIAAGVAQHLAAELQVVPARGIVEQASQLEASFPVVIDGYYDAPYLAARWRLSEGKAGTNAVHAILEAELPRARVGAGRGRTLFYGLDVLRYEGRISEDQYRAISERKLAILEGSQKEPARIWRLGDSIDAGSEQGIPVGMFLYNCRNIAGHCPHPGMKLQTQFMACCGSYRYHIFLYRQVVVFEK